MCQKFVWLIIFAASWGKLKVIPFIIIPNGDIFLFKKKEGMLVIYIQLLQWNKMRFEEATFRPRKHPHVDSNVWEVKKISRSWAFCRAYLCHARTVLSHHPEPQLWNVTCSILVRYLVSRNSCGALRWHVSLLLWNPTFHQHSVLRQYDTFDDTLLIFIVLPETSLSYTMYL